jgi:hypothetical protein
VVAQRGEQQSDRLERSPDLDQVLALRPRDAATYNAWGLPIRINTERGLEGTARMEEIIRQHLIPVAIALIIGYLMRYTAPRSRVVWWFPAALQFNFPFTDAQGAQQMGIVWTHALNIQNRGWLAARQVEIVHQARPQVFRFQPAVNFTEATTPTGEHVITIPTLARREWVSLQVLSAQGAPPQVTVIRSEDGPAIRVATIQQFALSKPRRSFFLTMIAIGCVTTLYLGSKLVVATFRLLERTLAQ